MAIAASYPGSCKDCGTSYAMGDQIDTNGKESLNKNGVMKPHWCKNGRNCQGTMQISSTTASAPTEQVQKGPSAEELRVEFTNIKDSGEPIDGTWAIIEDYIEVREKCEKIGITNPAVIGMILNNKVRDRN